MRNIRLVMLICVVLAAAALGDTVYLKNGQMIEGKATRKGDKVLVEIPNRGTVVYAAKDVLDIDTSSVGVSTGPATGPAATQPVPTTVVPSAASKPSDDPMLKANMVAQPTRPESTAFMLMRSLSGTPDAVAAVDLREQLASVQGAVHDQKRRCGAEWFVPKDFLKRREAFDPLVKDAKASFPLKLTGTTAAKVKEYHDAVDASYNRLRGAAATWADPTIRNFLQGVTEYEAGQYAAALAYFRPLRTANPYVAGFCQGEALSYIALDRGMEALPAAMAMVRLRPDSQDALMTLKLAMNAVPGALIRQPTYVEAAALGEGYPEFDKLKPPVVSANTVRTISWQMPGAVWPSRDDSLPTPPYDRLVLRQAVGVPVTDSLLLLDAETIADASEVFVRVDADTVVPATPAKVSVPTTSGSKAAPPPLGLVLVTGYTFTPLTCDPKAASAKVDDEVTGYGIGPWEEMGRTPRQFTSRVKSVAADGSMKLTAGLLAGEVAGPIIAGDNRLAGFFAGKCDAMSQTGGDDLTIDVRPLVTAANRLRPSSYSSYGGMRAKRTVTTQPAAGKTFVVYAVCPERFADK